MVSLASWVSWIYWFLACHFIVVVVVSMVSWVSWSHCFLGFRRSHLWNALPDFIRTTELTGFKMGIQGRIYYSCFSFK